MGELQLQLQIAIEKLQSRFGVSVTSRRPQVAWRETIAREQEVRHVHKKQSGGPGQFAEVTLRVTPLKRGEGLRFESRIVSGAIPKEYIPGVEAGGRRAAQAGVLGGFPVVDVEVLLLDGSYLDNDSSVLAFDLAGAAAFREATRRAGPVLLEPVMKVDVTTPPDELGSVIGDLARRRGEIVAQDTRGNAALLTVHVPLQEMFGYIGTLRALTSGRAGYSMQFEGYSPARAAAAAKVIAV